jgi:hypothetical protein
MSQPTPEKFTAGGGASANAKRAHTFAKELVTCEDGEVQTSKGHSAKILLCIQDVLCTGEVPLLADAARSTPIVVNDKYTVRSFLNKATRNQKLRSQT